MKHWVKIKGGRVAKKEVHHLEFKVIQKEPRKMATVLGAIKHTS
jgi:hypothetical protein